MRKPDAERIIDLKQRAEALLKEAAILEEKETKRIADANRARYQFQGEHLDSVIPELATLKREQFKEFIKKALLTPFAKKELAAILTPQQPPENQNQKGTATHGQSKNGAHDPTPNGNPTTQKQGESASQPTQGTGTQGTD
jgi:secreted Zn-dependent insulinase-like peptidase